MLYTGGVMGDLIYAVYWWGDGRSYAVYWWGGGRSYAVYWWGDARSYICCILVGWWEILYMLYTGGVMGDLMLYTGGVVGDLMLYTGGVMRDLIYAVYWWGGGRSYICCVLVG